MKWILGGLLLAVVALVVFGIIPTVWVLYCFAMLFAALASALVFAYWRSRHPGLLLLAATYFVSALAAIVLNQGWPLIAGFALVWVLRMMGMEPEAEEIAGTQEQSPTADGEKKS